jgi:RNA polymerase sigma-70 factor (ECF subfamily)
VNDTDGDDITALARTYGPTVFRAAWRVLGSRAAAEDVQQQLFLRLIESPPPRVESWPAYLATSATRLAIDHLRRQRRWRLLAPLWNSGHPEDAPDEDAEREQASARRCRASIPGMRRVS